MTSDAANNHFNTLLFILKICFNSLQPCTKYRSLASHTIKLCLQIFNFFFPCTNIYNDIVYFLYNLSKKGTGKRQYKEDAIITQLHFDMALSKTRACF